MMKMKEIWGGQVELSDGELKRRENLNRDYMMSLQNKNLLLNYDLEAGRASFSYLPKSIHGGWESPTCQLRGHFTGHWLSAAAMHYYETGDRELKAKADAIVEEIAQCQKDNGGEWAAPIPEKYLEWIAAGKPVWAPHYTIHKVFMGLLDMYQYASNRQALDVAERFAEWFYRYSGRFTREEFDRILDVETGGMLEVWVQLYEITGNEKYRTLMDRYYRGRLFDRLLSGADPLTNMHANTTIPEVIGCARAYDATGEQKWRDIAEAYWKCAVTDRGTFVTGGQTCGEIWTPMKRFASRLGDKNQEHCTVYNMMRLADFLFRWTKDPAYAAYREKNLYNGIMAQAYWRGSASHGLKSDYPDHGLLTYFLPLRAGGRKGWSSETEDFFCCHGTLVQANAALNRGIYYQQDEDIYVCQHFNSSARFEVERKTLSILQKQDSLAGSFHLSSTSAGRQSISDITSEYPDHPDSLVNYLLVCAEEEVFARLHIRIPEWAVGSTPVQVTVNGEPVTEPLAAGSFTVIERVWGKEDTICLIFPKEIHAVSLPEDPDTVAFTYGPLVLAGLCEEERTLHLPDKRTRRPDGERTSETNGKCPEAVLVHDNEREWGNWKASFKTVGQDRGIRFIPLNEVGYEAYQVYFPIELQKADCEYPLDKTLSRNND